MIRRQFVRIVAPCSSRSSTLSPFTSSEISSRFVTQWKLYRSGSEKWMHQPNLFSALNRSLQVEPRAYTVPRRRQNSLLSFFMVSSIERFRTWDISFIELCRVKKSDTNEVWAGAGWDLGATPATSSLVKAVNQVNRISFGRKPTPRVKGFVSWSFSKTCSNIFSDSSSSSVNVRIRPYMIGPYWLYTAPNSRLPWAGYASLTSSVVLDVIQIISGLNSEVSWFVQIQ